MRDAAAVEGDADLMPLALEEAESAAKAVATAEAALLGQDEDADSNAIVEITAGVGGDEAGLFAADLVAMYSRLARRRGWSAEVLDLQEGRGKAIKGAILRVEGRGAFSLLRNESGSHRVQRFSVTASKDVKHTSAAAVVVLPEADDAEFELKESDLEVDRFKAGGCGGQHQNKTESGVRVTHLPTGLSVEFREKSQHRNLENAKRVLAARLRDHYQRQQETERGDLRRSLRGRGTRCEKVRTYNFLQDRVTDHRLNKTVHGVERILDGDLSDFLTD